MRLRFLLIGIGLGYLGFNPTESLSSQIDRFEELAGPRVFIDHVGYDQDGSKTAVLELPPSAAADAQTFELLGPSDQVVFSGELKPAERVADWSQSRFQRADFSDFATSGIFKLRVRFSNGSQIASNTFEIAKALHFRKTFDKALDYFYKSRAVSEPAWSWDRSLRIIGNWGMEPVNLQGGWYDAAGDISKYLSHLSFANYMNPQQTPLTVWALAAIYEQNERLPQNRPDQGQRLLDEAQFGSEFLAKMLSREGYFYISVFDQWRGTQGNRWISVPVQGSIGTQNAAVQAAYREGGGMAIAALARTARLTASKNAELSSRFLQAAQTGFAHLEQNNRRYCDDGKENIIDDYTALLAATELAITTGDNSYLEVARQRARQLNERLSDVGYFFSDSEDVKPEQRSRPFWHAADAGLPVVALARYLELEQDQALIETTKNTIKNHLAYQLRVNREVANPFNYSRQHFRLQGKIRSGFFIPHENETTYWWQGENARLGSLATAALIGGRKVYAEQGQELPKDLRDLATDQIAWILGKNPFDVSFMESVGRNNPPHYSGKKPGHGNLPGGIANGITGRVSNKYSAQDGSEVYLGGDGTGIAWNPSEANPPRAGAWENWRWVEQWLPHTTWYMLAISAMAEVQAYQH